MVISIFYSNRRRHKISKRDWSSDVCSSDLVLSDTKTPLFSCQVCAHWAHLPFISPIVNDTFFSPVSCIYLFSLFSRSEDRRVGEECCCVCAQWVCVNDACRDVCK